MDGNGYNHADSQYGRDGYDHLAGNQYVNGYDNADYQDNAELNERKHRADDQYGGCRSDQITTDMESVDGSVSMKNTIFIVMIATYTVNTSGEIIRTILTPQPKQNQFIGKGGMNVYNNGVIHCDYIPYNACFTGMYCILPLFR